MSEELKRLAEHPRLRRAVARPMVFASPEGEREVIPKTGVLCDFCNASVDLDGSREKLPDGYALLCGDGCHVTHVLCEECARGCSG